VLTDSCWFHVSAATACAGSGLQGVLVYFRRGSGGVRVVAGEEGVVRELAEAVAALGGGARLHHQRARAAWTLRDVVAYRKVAV